MRILITLLIFFHSHYLFAQNLLPNPSFELINYCETKIPCSPAAWYSVSNIPYGYQNDLLKPFNGKHAIAFLIALEKEEIRTYWQTMLLCDLQPQEQYVISYYLYAPKQNFKQQYFAVHLSDSLFNAKNDTLLLKDGTLPVYEQKILKNGWYKISMLFEATGKEKYMLLGNFNKQSNKEILKNANAKYLAYYIDDISLKAVGKNTTKCKDYNLRRDSLYAANIRHADLPNKTDSKIILDMQTVLLQAKPDTLVLGKLNFNFDSDKLLGTETLNKYFDSINISNIEQIEIIGYTDSIGDKTYNLKLSERRALSVKKYIVEKYNLAEHKIKTVGKGITVDEILPEDNRRVELKIYKKD